MSEFKCNYCNGPAVPANGLEIYPHRRDLAGKKFIWCEPCDAYVGCHKGQGYKPLGTLSNKELRSLRMQAHKLFDPIWKTHRMGRREAYRWLSGKMEVHYHDCHIGQFNVEQCKKVIEIMNQIWEEEKNGTTDIAN